MDSPIIYSTTDVDTRSFINKVYGWMAIGLAVTGWLAGMIGTREAFVTFLLSNRVLFYGLIIGEFALVIGLTAGINKMTSGAATMAFLAYAAFNGITLSVIFLAYTASSITSTFFITAATFGVMSMYGYVTKTDLTRLGNIMFMALIGVVLASLVNMFFRNETVYWITSYLSVLVFTGLTAYDTQKIKNMATSGEMGEEDGRKLAIIGALALYLDFVNLFLSLLRIMGKRKN